MAVLRREWIVRPNPAEIEKAKDGNRTTDLGVQEASVTLVVRAVSSLDGKWGGEARRKVMGVTEQRHRLLAPPRMPASARSAGPITWSSGLA